MSARCTCGHAAGSHSWHVGRCLICGKVRCPAFVLENPASPLVTSAFLVQTTLDVEPRRTST